MILFK